MVEYIEREAALDSLLIAMCGSEYQSRAMSAIRLLPAADVAPVRHGRWEVDEFGHFCTVCREYTEEVENGEGQLDPLITPYCPNCGAKMDLYDECKQDVER